MPDDCDRGVSLVDSMPVITCAGNNRQGKVAREITSKGYCSTKNQYYYGLRLHALALRRQGTIPFPDSLMVTAAEDNDLAVFKQERQRQKAYNDLFSTAVSKVRQPIEFFNWLNEKTTIQRAQKVISSKGLLLHTMGKIAIAFIYLIF